MEPKEVVKNTIGNSTLWNITTRGGVEALEAKHVALEPNIQLNLTIPVVMKIAVANARQFSRQAFRYRSRPELQVNWSLGGRLAALKG